MTQAAPLHLFDAFGVELEYMIVDRETLSVLPVTDKVLHAVSGDSTADVTLGELSWSNELVLHVIELKTSAPAPSLDGLAEKFHESVGRINQVLQQFDGCLMPSGMHPWMDPKVEMRLWPHEDGKVYQTLHRIFGCQGHGWSNLQSVQLNLPFADEAEFARLHAAIRLLLPILPALAASSPILEWRETGLLDSRLEAYRTNAHRIPSITGKVIPEPIFTESEYQHQILGKMYDDIAPQDPEGILRHEWLNARGAIARFDRNSIELRVLDMQESPFCDLAIARIIVLALRALMDERWTDLREQQAWPVSPLEAIFLATMAEAEGAEIRDRAYLESFGLSSARSTAGELWRHLAETLIPENEKRDSAWVQPLRVILEEGCLARRIVKAAGRDASRERIRGVYRELCGCLARGEIFRSA